MTDTRWLIVVLQDDDQRRYYTGTYGRFDQRLFVEKADDPIALAYLSAPCCVNDMRTLMAAGLRVFAEPRAAAKHRDRVMRGQRARRARELAERREARA